MNRTIPILSILAVTTLAGCVAESPRIAAPAPPLVPDTNVYFYPAAGRDISAQQQDRDRYECNQWAVQQSGFDLERAEPAAASAHADRRGRTASGRCRCGWRCNGRVPRCRYVAAVGCRTRHADRGARGCGDRRHRRIRTGQRNQPASGAGRCECQPRAERRARTEGLGFRRAIGACLEARGYSVR